MAVVSLEAHQQDPPGKFLIFREDFQFKPYLQGFRYTGDMERLAEGRIVARYIAEPIVRKKGRAMADPEAKELGKGVTLVGLARARSPVNLDQSPSGG